MPPFCSRGGYMVIETVCRCCLSATAAAAACLPACLPACLLLLLLLMLLLLLLPLLCVMNDGPRERTPGANAYR